MYQSGCAGALTADGIVRAVEPDRVDLDEPADEQRTTAAIRKNRPTRAEGLAGPEAAARRRCPRAPAAVRNWVCFWSHRISEVDVDRRRSAGPAAACTWMTNSRLMMSGVGNSPPKISDASHGPMNGIDSSDRVR